MHKKLEIPLNHKYSPRPMCAPKLEQNNSDMLFIYPTDTVWGVGGQIYSRTCHEAVRKIKGIEKSDPKPVSILFNSIEMLKCFFDVPTDITDSWLSVFLGHESTILFPKHWASKELPSWIVGNSSSVGVRCLLGHEEGIGKIIKQVSNPIVSTSLNVTGRPPIKDRSEAFQFFKTIENSFENSLLSLNFIDDSNARLSGHSSSIFKINDRYNGGYEISLLRAGYYVKELEEHCRLLSA